MTPVTNGGKGILRVPWTPTPAEQSVPFGSPQPKDEKEKDVEVVCNVDRPSHIPEGNYEVGFVRAEDAHLWGRRKLFLHFKVVQAGEWVGTPLFMCMNLPTNGHFSISSKYLQQWSLAAGKATSRRDRLSTKVFRGKIFSARVRTVTSYVHSSRKIMERDPSNFYSVIDHLIEVKAGR
jgi:hypothetical protein